VTSGLFHGIPGESVAYSGQHSRWNIRVEHDGKVGCNSVKCTAALLYFDWLFFL